MIDAPLNLGWKIKDWHAATLALDQANEAIRNFSNHFNVCNLWKYPKFYDFVSSKCDFSLMYDSNVISD